MEFPDSIDVLVVDDEPDYSALVATQLEAEEPRLDVETAASVEDGLNALESGSVECIIADDDVPDQDGIAFLRAARAVEPDLPFVLLTGTGSEEVASEAIRAGVTAYFPKHLFPEQFSVLANRVHDAVEAYRAEQELEERRRELVTYERLLHSMPESAALYDEQDRFLFVNENLAEWYGRPREQLEGTTSDLIPMVRDAREGDPFEPLYAGEERTLSGTIEGTFSGQGTAVLEYRFSPLVIDDGVEGVIGVTRDVTERHRREQALKRTKEAFETLFDGMNDTAWVIDLDGEFRAVNDTAVETLGYSREELLSMAPADIDSEMSDAEIAARIEALPADGVHVFETVHETNDGREIPVEVSSSMVTYRDEPAILSVARDISSRKERERRLEQFASVVSHDLRNPLNVAQGRLDLAAADCESEHLDAVADAHDQMAALIEDLLTLAREDVSLSVEPVELRPVVAEAWAGIEAPEATLSIDVEATVAADPDRLRRLFANLLRNAVEHSTGPVRIQVGRCGDGVSVADDGPGIEDDPDAIFDAGYSTAEQGTGIGLSIVEQIATAHGWSITVSESEDGGARFELGGMDLATD
mgnify:CR=1 FL=1